MGIVRILLFGDTHLGFDFPFKPRIKRPRRGYDFFANVDRVMEAAIKHRVDGIVHTGDLLYRSKVPQQLVDKAHEPINRIADRGIPVYIVPGNHERSAIPTPILYPGSIERTSFAERHEKKGYIILDIAEGESPGGCLRAHERISSQSLGVEAPAWQGAKVQEYLDIPNFRNAARRDASADKM